MTPRVFARPYAAVRTALLVALLAGIYVVMAVPFGIEALLLVPMIQAVRHHQETLLVSLVQILAIGNLPGLIMIGYGILGVRRSPDGPWVSVPLAREAAPRLWAAVEQVAAQVQTRAPSQLYLAAAANAAVTETPRLLGLLPGPRRLTLGLPLLLGLSEPQLKAVIAHEMGHYAHGHTRLGARVYLGSVSLRTVSLVLGALRSPDHRRASLRVYLRVASIQTWIAYGLFSAYSAFYDAVTFGIRRGQELDADATAAEQYGARITGDALRSVHALPAAWSRFVDGVLDPMQRAGWVPDDPFSAFEAMLSDTEYEGVLAGLKQAPPREPTPRDSHPSLKERLARLPEATDVTADDAAADDPAPPAVTLLTTTQRHHAGTALGRAMIAAPSVTARDATLTVVPWQRWLKRAAVQRVNARSAELLRCARQVGAPQVEGPTDDATLATVLDLLADGRAADLEEALADDRGLREGTAGRVELLTVALIALVARYTARRIPAEWRLSWASPYRLLADNTEAARLERLTTDAADRPGTQLDALRQALAAAGIDPADPPPPTEEEWDEHRARAAAATTVRIDAVVDRSLMVRQARFRAIQISMTAVILSIGVAALVRGFQSPSSENAPVTVPGQNANPLALATPYATPYAAQLAPYATPSLPDYTKFVPVPRLTPVFPYLFVRVEPGDTLTSLACEYQTTVADLQHMNEMGDSTAIYAGKTLLVPLAASGAPTRGGCR